MNRLAQETSPYLLQHQHDPVDWYPWGTEAWERARNEDKPVFLSIGYAACHWCHVMERESFEDPRIAALLNSHFVCVKVDREERPDVDQIYMQAVQLLGGRGGWPLSMFLTPDGQPFYGGTYWPPTARGGLPGFDQVLTAVVEAWTQRRPAAVAQAAELTRHLQNQPLAASEPGEVTLDLLHTFRNRLSATFDPRQGGFGQAPKFPRAMDLQVLLRLWYRDRDPHTLHMVRLTLDKMASGGIYDHLGGGFARYSVDDRWLVPHFEKMLYDNALLAEVYVEAYLATRDESYARVARETLDYVLRDLRDPAGGFHSSEDADSEGEEGKFYVWTVDEVRHLLGEQAAEWFCRVYDVTAGGNFEGRNILHTPKTIAQCAAILRCDPAQLATTLAGARARLLAARAQRPCPGRDDKILLSWNALMIQALARGAVVLDEPRYLTAARTAAEFLLHHLRRADGRLLHCWRRGEAKLDAYLDDYACLIQALVTLYESDFAESRIDQAVQLSDMVLVHFQDPTDGSFFYTADDHESLIARTKETVDGSVPSSNGMLATALIRLGRLTGRVDLLAAAQGILQAARPILQATPEAAAQSLVASDLWLGPTWEIAICAPRRGPALEQTLQALRRTYLPRTVTACRTLPADAPTSDALAPLFAGKRCDTSEPVAYLCEAFACQAPVQGSEAIRALWAELNARG